MKSLCRGPLAAVVLVLPLAVLGTVSGQDKKETKKETKKEVKKRTFTDAKEAGVEHLVQGEYQGKLGTEPYGVQVVAKGNRNFDVYFLKGGLPGAGWDLSGKVKATAMLDEAGKAGVIKGKGVSGEITVGEQVKLAAKVNDANGSFVHVERKSPTIGAKPPEGAIILFDGTESDNWSQKKVVDGNLPIPANSKKKFKDYTLHIEFRSPFQPFDGGQGRGNSGVYIRGGTEIQVLDSFGLNGENNECGGLYGSRKPNVNMCLPPLTWQTYDVDIVPDPDNAKRSKVTVRHNGVLIHENIGIDGGPASINLQDHGNPVVYRNIWLVEKK